MIILPAIDIKDGNCVRLIQGKFDSTHKVAESPIISAMNFKNLGSKNLHIVDLDGSLEKRPVNHEIIQQIISETGLNCEIGGGIRNMENVEQYISFGAKRVILGSSAMKDTDFVKKAIKKYPDHIAIGIDAKNGFVSTEGWIEESNVGFIEFAQKMEKIGVRYIIFTDISKDGMLSGPNFDQLIKLKNSLSKVNIIASGGIKDIEDIKMLKKIGMFGAICGKSIYAGTLDLVQALNEEEK